MWCTRLIVLNVCLSAGFAQSLPAPIANNPYLNKAMEYQRQGQFSLAQKQYEMAVRQIAGENSLEAGHILNAASVYYHELGKYPQAESTLKKSLAVWEKLLGPEDIALSRIVNRLACVYVETGQSRKAERLNLELWEQRLREEDPLSQDRLNLLGTMSLLQAQKGKLDAAMDLNLQAQDILKQIGDEQSLDAVALLNHMGLIQFTSKRYSEATDVLLRGREILQNAGKQSTFHGAVNSTLLAKIYQQQKKYEKAAPLLQQAMMFVESTCGNQSVRTAELMQQYSAVLKHLNRKKEGEQLAERARTIVAQSGLVAFTSSQVDIADLKQSAR